MLIYDQLAGGQIEWSRKMSIEYWQERVRAVSLLGAPVYMLGLLCVCDCSLSKYRFVVVRATIVDVGNLYIRPIDAQLGAKSDSKKEDNEKVEKYYCTTVSVTIPARR